MSRLKIKQDSDYLVLVSENDEESDYPSLENLQPEPDGSAKAWCAVFEAPILKFSELSRGYSSEIGGRIMTHLRTPAFWLGIACGMAARIMTKMAIIRAFEPAHGIMAVIAGIVACAGAGLAGGIAAYLVSTRFGHTNSLRGDGKDSVWNKFLWEAALTGLLGGIVGGCATNVGGTIVRAGSLAAGTAVGVAAGILQVGIKGFRASHEEKRWVRGQRVALGALLGAVGGALSISLSDLFEVHKSIAASLDQNGVVPLGQATTIFPYAPGQQPVQVFPEPLPLTPPASNAAPTMFQPLPHVIHHSTHHLAHYKHHLTHYYKPCPPAAHHVRHAHVTHHKPPPHIAVQAKPPLPLPMIQNVIIIQAPPVVTVSPPIAVPVAPVDPCPTGDCGLPCDQRSQIDLKGPCSDPAMSCVEKVSFNEKGDATYVTLEPATDNKSGVHFENNSRPVVDAPYWTHTAKDVTASSSTTQNGAENGGFQVSLVMPFQNRMASSIAVGAPEPA